MAAPGRNGVAHGITHQAHAPQYQEQAYGRAAQRQRQAAHQGMAHEGKVGKGLPKDFVRRHGSNQWLCRVWSCAGGVVGAPVSSRWHTGASSSQFCGMPLARARLAGVSTSVVGPQAMHSLASSRGLRKMAANLLVVVQHCHHGTPFAAPSGDHRQQVGGGLGVQRGKWFIQQDQLGILQQQAGEQHPLETGRQTAHRPDARQSRPCPPAPVRHLHAAERTG